MDSTVQKRIAVLIFGPMGTGKSEISTKLAEREGFVYINPDSFWDRSTGVEFEREKGDKNFSKAYGEMIYCIQRGKSFLLDSALKRKIDRQEVITILRDMNRFVPEYNFKIIGCYVNSSLDKCLQRNRSRTGSQPEETIKKYHQFFEIEVPNKSEGFDTFYKIENDKDVIPDLSFIKF